MSVLTDNALPLLCMMIPALLALKMEYKGKHKVLWASVSVILTAAVIVYLAVCGAELRIILLAVLVPLLAVLI